MPLVFQTPHRTFQAEADAALLVSDAAERAGLALNMRCGGNGTCSGCLMLLREGRVRVGDEVLAADGTRPVPVRSCQARPAGDDVRLFVPGTSLIETSAQIEDAFLLPPFAVQPAVCRVTVELADGVAEHARADAACVAAGFDAPRWTLEALGGLGVVAATESPRATLTLGRVPHGWQVLEAASADDGEPIWGIAVDIGTTTVAVLLVDLRTGRLLRRASRYNGQIGRADDVAARISYASRSPENLAELRDLVVRRTINPLIAELCRAEGGTPRHVWRVAIAGNTVMSHLFLGLSPQGIGRYPFRPVTLAFEPLTAAQTGLVCHPQALVDVAPGIAGYVGGDIVADLLLADIEQRRGNLLLVDIGTNGEIVLATADGLRACATAAGPAFEGHGITAGCRAATGAIEHVRLDPKGGVTLDVIGDAEPIGLCGTGIIDFIAEALRAGWLDRRGRFDLDRLRTFDRLLVRQTSAAPSNACILARADETPTGEPLVVTEGDIAQILKAKAAIYAGIKTLVEGAGLKPRELDGILLAGGFGRHLDLRNAITLGLLPEVPLERIHLIGNGSLGGACRMLLDARAPETCTRLARAPRVVELNLEADFEDSFVDALLLPHFDDDEFPGVVAELPFKD
jgi:uncharacterized 2Fe-2S/4Fe-4S cluster protein (DUF4445 family)